MPTSNTSEMGAKQSLNLGQLCDILNVKFEPKIVLFGTRVVCWVKTQKSGMT